MSAELPRQPNSVDLDPKGSRVDQFLVPEASTQELPQGCPTDEELAKWELLGQFLGRAMSVPVAGRQATDGQAIGRFNVLRILGRGGHATVYHALDPLMGREVAIKLPHPFVIPSEDSRGRFLQEAKILSELVHANIVSIFDVGHDRDWPFLVFEYCAGGSLADWLTQQQQPLSPGTCSQIVLTLSLAAHGAHTRGILHRDVNPRNVLLLPLPDDSLTAGAKEFPFVAKLSDFGLGTWLDDQKTAVQTLTDTVMGTLPYMAPEQTRAGDQPLQATTDVYALGVILYELLTRQRPFVGESPVETLGLIRNQEPTPLRQLRKEIPRDLETICLHCLRKTPDRRYPSAAELADDLGRFLAGDPIGVRPVGVIERTVRWVGKRRMPVGIASLLITLLVSIGVGVMWYSGQLEHATQARQQLMQKTKDQDTKLLEAQAHDRRLQSVLRNNYYHHVTTISEQIKAPSFPAFECVQKLRESIPQSSSDTDLRGFEWYYLMQACGGDAIPVATLAEPTLEIHAMHVAESGDRVFIAEGHILTEWDVHTGEKCRVVFEASRGIRDFAVSTRQNQIAIARFNHADVEFRHLNSGAILRTDPCPFKSLRQCNRVFFDSDHSQLRAVFSRDRYFQPLSRVIAYPVGSAAPIGSGFSHDGCYYDIVIDPKTRDLISTADQAIHVAIAGKELQPVIPLATNGALVTALAISSDGELLAVATERNEILMCRKDEAGAWRQAESLSSTGNDLPIPQHTYLYPRNRLQFGRDNRTLYMSQDNELSVWDIAQRKVLHSMTGLPGKLRYLELLGDRETAVWTTEKVMGLWRPPIDHPPIEGHVKEAWSVGFSPDGKVLATGSDDESVRLWDLTTGKRIAELTGHIATVTRVEFSPTGKLIASASLDETVRVWDARTLKLLRIVNGQSGRVDSIAWFNDGRRMAVTDSAHPTFDQRVLIWDTLTGSRIHCLEGCLDRIRAVLVTADQRHVIASSNDKSIRIWNAENGELEQSWKTKVRIGCLALLSQDRWLASAGDTGAIQVHRLSDGELRRNWTGHAGAVRCLAVSPDGRVLVSGGADRSIRLWDVETGASLLVFKDQTAEVNGLAFSPSGETLAAALHDGSIVQFHAPRFKPLGFNNQD